MNILQSMYSNVKGQVKLDGVCSELFLITIGLRQGCNLSPHLFNLYIDDLAKLLERASYDPVMLNGENVSCLMYADDMLLLSSTESGLQRSLNLLGTYCDKWQLVVNTSKTKVMVFNKRDCRTQFKYKEIILDIVSTYSYLGILINKNGSLKDAIKTQALKAEKAFFALKSMLQDCDVRPRLAIKLFDSLVKPVL